MFPMVDMRGTALQRTFCPAASTCQCPQNLPQLFGPSSWPSQCSLHWGTERQGIKAQQSWLNMGQFWLLIVTIELPEGLAEALMSLYRILTSALASLTNHSIFYFPRLSWFLYQKFCVPRNLHPRQTRIFGCYSPILLPSPFFCVDS